MQEDSNQKKKGGFFKNNPFFSVEEKEEAPVAAAPPVTPATTNFAQTFNAAVPFFNSAAVPAPVIENESELDQEYIDHFMQFMEAKNFPGLDYLEFATTLHKMAQKSGTSFPEGSLYELAFVSFEAQGVNAATLVKTAQDYIGMITAHKNEFDKFLTTDGSKDLQNKIAENTRLEKANTDASLQIAQLQQQILNIQNSVAQNTQTIQANLQFISAETAKNNNKKRRFDNAFNVVINKITSDMQKIQSYIK